MERSVVLIKPDGVQRGLVGSIMTRFERKGLKLVGLKMMNLNDPILDTWYEHHKGKPFFEGLKNFMKSAPIVAMLWEGVEAVNAVRKITGITKAREAEAGSIRGDYGMSQQLNLIHCSDSLENAQKEEKLCFDTEEIYTYDKGEYLYVYSSDELEK
jgi:nucleoside-diphosphate kinase